MLLISFRFFLLSMLFAIVFGCVHNADKNNKVEAITMACYFGK